MTNPTATLSTLIPFLVKGAVKRTGDASIPGAYCEIRQVWMHGEQPIISSAAADGSPMVLELATKTRQELERDDEDRPFLLELATKTDNRMERDD